jgi:hypothetical protein
MRRTTWWRTPVGVGSPVFGRGRRPSSRRSVAEARWYQSPRYNASLIGLRVRVCGGAVGTMNVGFRAPAKPLFYMALREGGPTATNGRRPRSGRVWDRDPATGSDPEIIPRDHIPTIVGQLLPSLVQCRRSAALERTRARARCLDIARFVGCMQCRPAKSWLHQVWLWTAQWSAVTVHKRADARVRPVWLKSYLIF